MKNHYTHYGIISLFLLTMGASTNSALAKGLVSWTGYYSGINVGSNSGRVNLKGLNAVNQYSPLYSISVEIPVIGQINWNPKGGDFKVGKRSVGIHFGHLQEVNSSPFVIGWEVSLNKFKSTQNNSPLVMESESKPYVHNMTMKGGDSQIKFNTKLNGIIGYKVKESFLPYISFGVSFTKINLTIAKSADSCTRGEEDIKWSCESFSDYPWGRNQILSTHTYLNYGYNYGVGLFYALTDNVIINAEISKNRLFSLSGYMGSSAPANYTSYQLGLSYKF